MYEVRCVKSKFMFPVIEEILDTRKRVRITVTGMSMYPFLRSNKDSVELERTNVSQIRLGDILLVLMEDGQYILHRVIRKKKNAFYLNGDAQKTLEGPVLAHQVIAKVVAVRRNEKNISCSSPIWKILSCLWIIAFPIRLLIIKSYSLVRRFLKQPLFRRI